MGWYNGGNWDSLKQNEIPTIIAELCNGLNERREVLTLSRETWPTATGSTSGAVAASDFDTLAFGKVAAFTQCFSAIMALMSPAGGYSSSAHYSGFSKTGTDTGLASEGDLWTAAAVATEIGMDIPETPFAFFDARPAIFMREMLDRMIYPVIYPAATIEWPPDSWGSNYGSGPSNENSAANVWEYMIAGGGSGGGQVFQNQINAVVISSEIFGDIYYSAFATPSLEVTLRNLNYGGGAVSKQWFSYSGGRTDTASEIEAAFGDGASVIDFPLVTPETIAEFEFTDPIPLDGTDLVEPFVIADWPIASLPFNGSRDWGSAGNSFGDGFTRANIRAKRLISGGSIQSGFQYIRQILNIAGELTDQA